LKVSIPYNGFDKTRMKFGIALLGVLTAAMLGVTVELRGADGQTAAPRLLPDKVEFGVQDVGRTGVPTSVMLSNPGPVPLQIASILASGIDFSQTNDCGKVLATGAQCTIRLVFTPATIGPRIGQLSVISSVPVQPSSLPLSGSGQ
jgi:hypothetical protein